MKLENTIVQMKKGVLEMCILSILNQKEAYPSDIIQQLKTADLIVLEGTLYPLLTRLKNFGLLEYYWQESTSGPPRKYYSITEQGKESLLILQESWNQFVQGVNQSLKTNINYE
ncbi:MAG: PadR family transcriptional regulator [Saprospiraceae bacterium]|nr:PadR family transcriptional regulator [Saprospiraceae bacterium]MBK7810142.1 PadR family transcriptional regulator [Saprospiraceae bacterium]